MQADTFHQLIQQHRQQTHRPLNFEYYLMAELYEHLDKLTVLQKVELLRHALTLSAGTDLEQVLWKKSPNSEVWLEHRTVYTRSLAVMSMVGYILGVGDRHPSNLMLCRNTGLVVHIDFGDCFDVAQQREKYPEKIPFRLTRMLVLAMEASGAEGTFRLTSERVLNLLRENKDSFMTVLETFIYDPLINWRLTENENTSTDHLPEDFRSEMAIQEFSDLPISLNTRRRAIFPETTAAGANAKALESVKRVTMKLTGRFNGQTTMKIPEQV
jgi:FKBP12-rapamycin complex-associated protein